LEKRVHEYNPFTKTNKTSCCDARAAPFVPQACLTARKTLKTGWRSLWYLEVAGHGPCGRPHPMYVIIFIVGRWQGAE